MKIQQYKKLDSENYTTAPRRSSLRVIWLPKAEKESNPEWFGASLPVLTPIQCAGLASESAVAKADAKLMRSKKSGSFSFGAYASFLDNFAFASLARIGSNSSGV